MNGAPFRDGLYQTVTRLWSLSPTYNPATFSVASIIPALRPLQLALPAGNAALNDFYAGFATWAGLVLWLFVFSTPFTIVQLRLLRKADRARSTMRGDRRATVEIASNRSALQRHKRNFLSQLERISEFNALIIATFLVWVIIAVRLHSRIL